MDQATTSEPERGVQISLISATPRHHVSEVPISVPDSLRRRGLSEIVNHLLNYEQPVAFDFLVNGQLLRSSLGKHLANQGLSSECVLNVEYFEAQIPPTHTADFKHDDWVAACHMGQNGLALTGTYDNAVYVWGGSGQCLASARVHSEPIKRVRWLKNSPNESAVLLSASQDHTVKSWEYNAESGRLQVTGTFQGHTGSVDGLAVAPSEENLLSASFDRTIRLWRVSPDNEEDDELSTGQTKRHKLSTGSKRPAGERFHAAQAVLNAHQGPVSSVVWPEENTAYSGGWDHTIHQWDVSSAVNVHSLVGSHVITDISYSKHSGLVAAAGVDRHVSVYDPREKEGSVIKTRLPNTDAICTALSWAPNRPHLLAAGRYDGSWCLWDVRSVMPLYTTAAHKGKILSLDWSVDDIVLTGGEDCVLGMNEVSTGLMAREK